MDACCKSGNETEPKLRLTWSNVWIIAPIRFYRYFISPMLGPRCRFEPSCSDYAEQTLCRLGVSKGLYYTTKRLLKCHPWHKGGYDPAPELKDLNKNFNSR